MCADATYKLIWQGYPVLLVGTTDRAKKFHPFGLSVTVKEEAADFAFIFRSLKNTIAKICEFDYNPTTLIADSSAAITNEFISLIRNVDIHLKLIADPKIRPKVRVDIVNMELALNEKIFDSVISLVFNKWSIEGAQTSEFLKYFKSEWINKNSGWYEGFSPEIPSTNNALESFNRTIKEQHMFGNRSPVGQFFEQIKNDIVRNWSLDRDPVRLLDYARLHIGRLHQSLPVDPTKENGPS